MSELAAAMTAIAAIQDRIDVTDVLYRYGSTIDRRDVAGIRSVLADDLWAQYGDSEPMTGGDTVTAWIDERGALTQWQHHLLSVFHVELDGDQARALIYHTSHQVMLDAPDEVKVIVGRYHNELTRTAAGWRISRLVMEVLWRETRQRTP